MWIRPCLPIPRHKQEELLARMRAFNYSGFAGEVLGNTVYYHKSIVRSEYKAWAQVALFISPYLNEADKRVWLGLSKVWIF